MLTPPTYRLDKDANKEKCLLRQEKANEKVVAAMGEETYDVCTVKFSC